MQRRFGMGTMAHPSWLRAREMCAWYNASQEQVYLTFEDEVRINPAGYAEKYDAHSSCDGCFTFHHMLIADDGTRSPDAAFLRVGLEIKTASKEVHQTQKNQKNTESRRASTCVCSTFRQCGFSTTAKTTSTSLGRRSREFTRSTMTSGTTTWCRALRKSQEEAKLKVLPPREEGFAYGWYPSRTCG